MTQLLQQAVDELKKLPTSDQNAIAALILEELTDERLWDETFARSQDKLAKLAEHTRAAIGAGNVREAGIDEL